MSKLNVYLNFNGECRDAMTFYKDCLGGELTIQTGADTPMASELTPETRDQVMHSMLIKDGFTLMASDTFGRIELKKGNSMYISVQCSSDEEIQTVFKKLSEGGTVLQPLADAFWGATFGMLVDKFGVHWMFNFDKTQK